MSFRELYDVSTFDIGTRVRVPNRESAVVVGLEVREPGRWQDFYYVLQTGHRRRAYIRVIDAPNRGMRTVDGR